jgi:hypothetical protein
MHVPKNSIQQLAEYIIKNLNKGYPLEALKVALEDQGYSKISVESAVELSNKKIAVKAPVMKEKPLITYKVLDDKDRIIKTMEISQTKKNFWKKLFGR